MGESDFSTVVARVCSALAAGDRAAASDVARREYPAAPPPPPRRTISQRVAVGVYLRDGFVDRYTGARLVFPGALLLLARLLPGEFPADPHWRRGASHQMFWDLWPTVDHVVPVCLGGAHAAANFVTASMATNARKGDRSVEELGWRLRPPGDLSAWDGMAAWFDAHADAPGPPSAHDGALRGWRKALHSARAA